MPVCALAAVSYLVSAAFPDYLWYQAVADRNCSLFLVRDFPGGGMPVRELPRAFSPAGVSRESLYFKPTHTRFFAASALTIASVR